jgi:outer membrane receptor protein involved in Fe transport
VRPLLWLLLASSPAYAGGGRNPFREPDESEFFKLDDKLVTVASRYAQSLRKAPNVVAVVDAAQIRERGYRTLGDALRDLPGLYAWPSREGRETVSFRGVVSTDNNKILLMVDGVPWYDGVYTHAWTDDYLPIHHIKRIEVIKGPGSAVYGTNAFAGVINLVTFKGEDLKGGRARVMGGSRGRLDASVTVGDTDEIAGLPVSVSGYARYFTQEGQGLDVTPRDRRDLRGEDPRRGLAVGAMVDAAGVQAQIHHIDFRHKYLTVEQDDLFDALAGDIDNFGLNYHATLFDLRYVGRPLPQLQVTPRLWSQRHDNPGLYGFWGASPRGGPVETLDITVVETEKDTRQWGAALDFEGRPHPDHVTVAGFGFDSLTVLELRDTEFRNFATEGEDTPFRAPTGARLRNAYGYASHTWTIGPGLEVTAGGRLDRRIPSNPTDDPTDDAFRLFASPRAGLLIAPSPTVNLKLLYGRAFRHANVRETLVSNEPGADGIFPFANGSLDLRPEQIDTVDAEITAEPSEHVTVRAAGSWSALRYEIDKINPPNTYVNIDGQLSILAAEAEVIGTAGPATMRAAYALTLARYGAAGPYANRPQFEFPPHMLKTNLTVRATERLSSTVTGEVYSPRPRRDWTPNADLRDGAAFGLLHLSVRAQRLGPQGRLELVGAVRNLTDTTYDTAMSRDEIDRVVSGPSGPLPRYPLQIRGMGRSVHVGIEMKL